MGATGATGTMGRCSWKSSFPTRKRIARYSFIPHDTHLPFEHRSIVNQIQQRGREYEESIRLDYLKRLNERYEAWISTYDKGKLLVIDIDNNRFPESQEDLGKIIHSIDAEINGLF